MTGEIIGPVSDQVPGQTIVLFHVKLDGDPKLKVIGVDHRPAMIILGALEQGEVAVVGDIEPWQVLG